MKQPLLGTLALALLVCPTTGQTPQVLHDVNTTPAADRHSDPKDFAQLGQQVLFSAYSQQFGRELWSYDTITGQVTMVADVWTGAWGSNPQNLTAFQGYVYFQANGDPFGGNGLWRTDGTTVEHFASVGGFDLAVELAGKLYFRANGSNAGLDLFCTDGITTTALDIHPGTAGSNVDALTVIGNELWFRAATTPTGLEPWRTDGTAAGTVLIADLNPGHLSSFPNSFYDLGSTVVFHDGAHLRSSDGTPSGTIDLGLADRVVGIGAMAYFTLGNQLFETDGTVANTQLVTTLDPIPARGSVFNMLPAGNEFFVNIKNSNLGPVVKTYLSDGTANGTSLLPVMMTTDLVRDGTTSWFGGTAVGQGGELWQSDGTLAGTTVLCETIAGPAGSWPQELFVVNGTSDLLFSSNVPGLGREPWACDSGTGSGQLVANLADEVGATLDSSASELVDAAGTVFFKAYSNDEQIWKSDGTSAGTASVVPAGPIDFSLPLELTTVGTDLYFTGIHPTSGRELFVTDGTLAGTDMFDMWLMGSSDPRQLTAAEDLLYFIAYNPPGGHSLWRTDGSQQGLIAISAQANLNSITDLTPLGRGLVFMASTLNGVGREPHYTDGTVQGTVLLGDLTPSGDSNINSWAVLGDKVYFVLNHQTLMVTDGTPQGTFDVFAGASNVPTTLEQLFAARDRLYFRGLTPATGFELWTSDGTAAGTAMLADLSVGTVGTGIRSYHAFGDGLLFEANTNGVIGIWHTDGTASGTVRLTDFYTPELLVAGEREAWFAGTDPLHGTELWRTDGTVAGTGLHADLLPGTASSFPQDFALSGGKLTFRAEHPLLGVEPWAMQLHATSQDVGYGCVITTRVPPTLWSDDPVLGQTMQLHVAHGPDPGISAMHFSNYTTAAWPLGAGLCDYFVAPNPLVYDLAVMPGGMATHQLFLPNAPVLIHQRFRMQSLTLPSTGLLQSELSNGLTLTLGN